MAKTSTSLDASQDEAWTALQSLSTWEGVAGIEDLREPRFDGAGNLAGFRFAMDTALGRVDGRAKVEPRPPAMTIYGEQKGLSLTIRVVITSQSPTASTAIVEAEASATSFLSKPLAITLNALLDSAIEDEAAKIASRVGRRDVR